MARRCGRCNRSFKFPYGTMLFWCKKDKTYVCRDCWVKHCKQEHGGGTKSIGRNPLFIFFLVSFIGSLVLPFAVGGFYHFYTEYKWSTLDRTDIGMISHGELVRIEGEINESSELSVIFGEEYRDRSSYRWKWKEDREFRISDPTGSVVVRTDRHYDIEDGPHPSPQRKHTDASAYRGGDEVIIVGEAERENGNLTVYVLWMGIDDADIPSSVLLGVLCISGLAIFIVLYTSIFVLSLCRNSKHRRWVEQKNKVLITDEDKPKTEGLKWRENRPVITLGRLGPTLLVLWILAVIGFWLIWWLEGSYKPDNIFVPVLYCMGVFSVLNLFTLAYFDRRMLKPSEVGVSRNGIHFHFREPQARFLARDFIAWTNVVGIRSYRAGKSSHWEIDTGRGIGNGIGIDFLTKENRNYIIGEWKRRRQRRP